MRRPTLISAMLAAVVLAAPAQAQDAQNAAWRPLFNGKNLDGWEHVGPGKMLVQDGIIRTEGGMGLLWYTGQKFGDCVIRVVYKTTKPLSNSGVFIRIADKPKDAWFAVHHGYEVQICDATDAFHCTGAVYSLSKATAQPSKVGEWNTMDITLRGERVMVELNGVKVQDFDPSTATVPPRKKEYEPERGPRPTTGYIGIQNHDDVSEGNEVYFKEISVRTLQVSAGK